MNAVSKDDKEILSLWDFPLAIQPGALRKEIQEKQGVGQGAGQGAERKVEDEMLSDGRGVGDAPKRKEEVEKEHILEGLEFTKGNITKAAKLLGWSRYALVYKMDKHGIPRNYGKP